MFFCFTGIPAAERARLVANEPTLEQRYMEALNRLNQKGEGWRVRTIMGRDA